MIWLWPGADNGSERLRLAACFHYLLLPNHGNWLHVFLTASSLEIKHAALKLRGLASVEWDSLGILTVAE